MTDEQRQRILTNYADRMAELAKELAHYASEVQRLIKSKDNETTT